jgi:hypothetical protein
MREKKSSKFEVRRPKFEDECPILNSTAACVSGFLRLVSDTAAVRSMKSCTYNSTPGLDRFPIGLRDRVWREAHKELMRSDSEYRQAVRRFTFRIIASTLVIVIISPVFTFLQNRMPDNTAFMVFSIVVQILLLFIYVFFLLSRSFRFQRFQNERVGQKLRATH